MVIKKIKLLIGTLFLLSIFEVQIFAGCCGTIQRESGLYYCPDKSCSWERGDGRCNDGSECCPGRRCNSFGRCVDCLL